MVDIISSLHTLNISISWGLLLLIWLVQIIIYPGFHRIPATDFAIYHRWYVIRISAFVLPLMICELILAIGWLTVGRFSVYPSISAFLIATVWLSTAVFQVPIHKRLQSGKNDILINRLVATNWIRTVAWTLKAAVVTISFLKAYS